MNTIFEEWDEYWFGYWGEFGTPYNRCPSATDFVDANWDSNERKIVLSFLEDMPLTTSVTSKSAFPCVFHGSDCIEWQKENLNSGGDLRGMVDNVLDLHPDIKHYIYHHNIRMPINICNIIKKKLIGIDSNNELLKNNAIPYDYNSHQRMIVIDPEGGGYANRMKKEAEYYYNIGDIYKAYEIFKSIDGAVDLSEERSYSIIKKKLKL